MSIPPRSYIGQITLNHEGDYSPTATYKKLDVVTFMFGSYMYFSNEPSSGHPPLVNGTLDLEHWRTLADAVAINAVIAEARAAAFRYPYEKVLLYYGYPIAINGAWSVEGAASAYSAYDIVILGDTYQDPAHDEYASTVAIMTRLQQLSPSTRIVGYVPIGLDPAWPDSNLTMAQLKARVEQWVAIGAAGIFLDEFGYDYYVTRARQNEIVSYCHDRGLFVFANSWSTDYVFNPNPVTIDWIPGFEPNPNGVAPVINENDYYLYENLFYTTRNLGTWENPNYEVRCANVWRLDDILRYFNEARIDGESYYTHYGTKLCSLDAIPSTFNAEDRMVLRSLSAIGAAILNIHAVAFGDQNWGASGYFEHWDLPVNLNLYSEGIHSVSVETRSYTTEGGEPSTFPYKWTATLGGQSWSIVFDIDTPDDVTYVYRKRYAALNGNEVINAWTTVFSFQSDVQTAVESAAQAVATCEALVAEAEDVLPTVTEKIEQLNGVISGGQSDIGALLSAGQQNINSAVTAAQQAVSNANSALDAGIADLEMLSSGFNFKEVMW